jgi:phage terminase small subunit
LWAFPHVNPIDSHARFFPPKKDIQVTTLKKHGGKRAGAGRPPAPPVLSSTPGNGDPLAFLLAVMGDTKADTRLRVEAARAALPYVHQKTNEVGKKDAAQQAAGKAAAGKYAPSRPPPLRSV